MKKISKKSTKNERKHTRASDPSLLRNSDKPVSRRKASTEPSVSRLYYSELRSDLGYSQIDYPTSDYQRKYET
jgi:hypothetical protein